MFSQESSTGRLKFENDVLMNAMVFVNDVLIVAVGSMLYCGGYGAKWIQVRQTGRFLYCIQYPML